MSRLTGFHKTGKGSFFGDFVYDRVVKKGHFFVALSELFHWDALCAGLIKVYKGRSYMGVVRLGGKRVRQESLAGSETRATALQDSQRRGVYQFRIRHRHARRTRTRRLLPPTPSRRSCPANIDVVK